MPAAAAERQIAKRNYSSFVDGEGGYKNQRTDIHRGVPSYSGMDLICDVEPHRDQFGHYEHQMHAKDEQIYMLQRKLEHFRAWLSGLQGQLAAKDPQLLKNARRLYVGGIPDGTKEEELRAFFEDVMDSTAATCAAGSSIASCKISSDKTYAFLEMRSVEEASNAMAFDGIVFKDVHLKIRRPSNYNAADALALGPATPDPTVDTNHLPICKTVVEDSWNKIFVGGLPCNYTEEQVKELLQPYGSLKSFNLVMDKATGKSKGYAFCEFNDPRVIPSVINGLHMQCLERKVLTVKRALEGNRQGGGSKTLAPPLGTSAAATTPGGSSSRLAAMPSGSMSSSSSSTALGFSGQQQQGFARGPGFKGGPAAAAAGGGAPAGSRPQMPPQHGERHGPAAAPPPGSSSGGDQGGFGGFYMSNSPGDNNGYDVTGFGAGFGPGMPPMGPPGSHPGFSSSGSSSRGFGSGSTAGYHRGGPVGFGQRGGAQGQGLAEHSSAQNPEGHPGAHQGLGGSHEFPPPPGGPGFMSTGQYHHHHQQQQQQQHGMMHASGSSWNGMFGQNPHARGPQGFAGPVVGHKGYPNPRADAANVPPYNSPKQYSNGLTHQQYSMADPSTPSPHPPTPPAGQLLGIHPEAAGSTVARTGSGAFSGTTAPVSGTAGSTAAASPVAAITAGARLSPGIGGGAATAAAALAGGPISHPLTAMTHHRVARSSSTGGDSAVHHNSPVVLPVPSDTAAAAAAAVNSISSTGSLYHHDNMSADTGTAATKTAAAAAAPAGEESADGSSSITAAAVDVLDD